MTNPAYDPLDYANLAVSVVRTLLEQPMSPLPPEETFEGPGVYAIYYHGDFPAYAPLVAEPGSRPIYVGKAIPAGGRKGAGADVTASGTPLYRRLAEHANTLAQARNLNLAHFQCRYLVVVPVWIGLAERFLVGHFRPLWNTVVDGFGNHDPGKGRRAGAKPRWDILHPGRSWARELRARKTIEEVLAEVEAYMSSLES